jgi:phage recombination protein Bet
METNEQNQLTRPTGTAVEYVPWGGEDKIKLTASMVDSMIAVPTRTGKRPTQTDCIKFIALCRSRRLNPFEGDCFMIGYDNQDGTATFALITAHQAFLKRAESNPQYDGMESGIIVQDGDEVKEVQGDFRLPDQKLLGGWCKVYRKDRKYPTYRRLKLQTFDQGNRQWKKDPEGMICKCTEADGLRSAFPTLLGGMRMTDDGGPTIDVPTVTTERVQIGSTPPTP